MLKDKLELLGSGILTAFAAPLAAMLVLGGQLVVVALVVIRAVLVRTLLGPNPDPEPGSPIRAGRNPMLSHRRRTSAESVTSPRKASSTPQSSDHRECAGERRDSS